ncbi:unnamed protein product [Linum tenue]|uniref:DNA-directed RNA polymerase subunit n=1 Tax=Linum tenue TaxID=586396 RepID=A0AAV0NSQ9_9ROSI|nr:unnamed protein product [Linum tenue]
MYVVQIEHSETTERGKPKVAGLSDPRLGTIDRKMKCENCTANMAECLGHFGHLELAKPMFHIGFMKTALHNEMFLLQLFEDSCRKILHASKKKTKCEGGDEIEVRGQDEKSQLRRAVVEVVLSSQRLLLKVLSVLQRISDEDCQLLGLNPKYARPDWMILQATQRSGRPIKSICIRLKAKQGRIRGNLLGKRVDFSARTVITPDPTINIDQLGVPWSIVLNLTYPETVTPYNIERLKDLVEYGPHPPPSKTGAKYIIRDEGQRLDLRYLKKSSDHHLELGYKAFS